MSAGLDRMAEAHERAAAEPNYRLKVALAMRYILRARRQAREAFGFSPVDFEVFLTVCSASADKLLRDPRLRTLYAQTQPVPDEEIRYLSARSVCAATGLNRETVRRSVNDLVERGWLRRNSRGYAVAPRALMKPESVDFFLAFFEALRQLTDRWPALDAPPET